MEKQVIIWLLKAIIFVEWFGLVLTQTLRPPRAYSDIANPLRDLERCGRKDTRSHVCNPDNIIPVDQANQLDELITKIYNDTQCPCSPIICRKAGPGGYLVGIAIIRAMKLDLSIRKLNYTREEQHKYMDAVLNEAQYFAYKLLQEWNMGHHCQEDILIFFSQYDSVLYTVTNHEARKKLTDDIVGEIAMNSRILFSHHDTIADGFKEILTLYRDVLVGNYKRQSIWNKEMVEDDPRETLSRSDASVVNFCLALTTLSLFGAFL